MILNKTVSISRLQRNPLNTNQEFYVPIGNMGNVKMNIQPADAAFTAVAEGVYGQTYQAFVSVSGLLIGDQVTVSGTGDVFIVHGVKNEYYGPIPHLEIVLFKGEQ